METIIFEDISLLIEPPVYAPREDSFLLAKQVALLAFGKVLDMGTGSGIQGITAAKKPEVTSVIAVDLNEKALAVAEKNAVANNVLQKMKFVHSNLFEKVNGKFDTIIYNPPYVPVEVGERLDEESMAWYGGATGRDFLDSFLEQFPNFLSTSGKLLLLQSSLNAPVKTEKKLGELGFNTKIIASESFFFEKIYVFAASRQ